MVDILGVLETRIKQGKAKKIIQSKFKDFQVVCNYSAHVNGRIWLIWKAASMTVIPLIIHDQFIHCEVTHHATCQNFQLTMVYSESMSGGSLYLSEEHPAKYIILYLHAQEKDLLYQYTALRRAEDMILRQKAKITHISYNDSSSKYFFARIHERKQQQIIGQIKDRHGQNQTGIENVASSFVEYYKHLLGRATVVAPLDAAYIQQEQCRRVQALMDSLLNFSKKSWNTFGPNFCKAVQDYFSHGRLSKQANGTLITLIPKKKISNTVMDFRPISCCTTFYKTISKILSVRLQTILPKFIGPEQAAFIKGRDIHENIMMSQTLVKGYARKYLTPRCLLKVDIRKVFDSLQWAFIRKERGDILSVTAVIQALEKNFHWSGLYANTEKTDIYFDGVSPTVKAQILQVTGFSEGSFPFRYLGFPLDTARLHSDTYGTLLSKIQTHLQHWSTKFFSYAGKVQLLNSVIFRIINFWCASALLPQNVIKTINKMCKKKFWNIEEGTRKLALQSWANICSPWEQRGLGIKELLSWNKSLLAKKI
ncbi:uncharacterized protein LOC141646033 [Silene latifolia]|uniref:uncharacterized protein LOC141646033 n=1 Tax=Silene latifolia TaxID=37657 RepID=UPI003D773A38